MKIKNVLGLVSVFVVLIIAGCGSVSQPTTTSTNLILSLKADFSRSGVRASSLRSLVVYPEVFITPDRYLIALKSAKLTKKGTSEVFEFFNYSSLDSCLIASFSSSEVKEVTLTTKEVTPANYEALKVEVYWVQERFPIKSGTSESVPASTEAAVVKNIRIYLTDDQAVETGRSIALGNEHHQGDLTIIGTDETTELGWFYPPADFSGTKPRPGIAVTSGYAANQNLDNGDPSSPHHDRGPFGG